MGNFADYKLSREKKLERAWEKKKANEKYYCDLSKLTFATLVLAQLTHFYNEEFNIITICIGVAMTIIFKIIGNNFLKQ